MITGSWGSDRRPAATPLVEDEEELGCRSLPVFQNISCAVGDRPWVHPGTWWSTAAGSSAEDATSSPLPSRTALARSGLGIWASVRGVAGSYLVNRHRRRRELPTAVPLRDPSQRRHAASEWTVGQRVRPQQQRSTLQLDSGSNDWAISEKKNPLEIIQSVFVALSKGSSHLVRTCCPDD